MPCKKKASSSSMEPVETTDWNIGQTVLKLDVDRPRRLHVRDLVQKLGRAGYTLEAYCERRSPGGRGWHWFLHVSPKPQSPLEVVALQAILGSDCWREACVLQRARAWPNTPSFARSWWNVLYQAHPAREKWRGFTRQRKGR